jgi:hypothetical protein
MRNLAILTACIFIAMSSTSFAGIDILSKPTRNMDCEAGVCTATATNAILNVTDLTNMLAKGDVTVKPGAHAVLMFVRTPLTWANGSKLTLIAPQITISHPVTIAGRGGVNIQVSDGPKDLIFQGDGHLVFWDIKSSLLINGNRYVLVNSIQGLAAAVAKNAAGNFALASNYDASTDGTYSATPVSQEFSGNFDGLGNRITHFTLVSTASDTDVALFAFVHFGTIYDLGMPNTNVQGADGSNVGAVAGYASNSFRTWATGKVSGGASATIGGLFGNGGGIDDRFAGTVTGGTGATVGGVGGIWGIAGIGATASSEGSVRGGDDSFVGGIGGYGACSYCRSSMKVTAGNDLGNGAFAGGLIGYLFGNADHSSASGSVTVGNVGPSVAQAGGLVANDDSDEITFCSAHGTVIGGKGSLVAGMAAATGSRISQSFATGDVKTGSGGQAGGFAGWAPLAQDNYSTGAVSGGSGSAVGGFIGDNSAIASTSYSIGLVTGRGKVGGFAGTNENGFNSDVWDLDTSGSSQGTGDGNVTGLTGLTDAQLKSALPAGFDPQIWGQSPSINNGYPYLLANPPQK